MSGKVSFFGLNAFGSHVGISPTWGAGIGVVSATGTAVGFRALTSADKHKWSELVGAGVGTAIGVGFMFSKKLRGAGFAAVVTALGSQGVLAVERMLTKGGMQGVTMDRVPQIRGLGMASMDRVPQLQGASGAHSLSNPAAAQIAASVPGTNALAKHFGATIWG